MLVNNVGTNTRKQSVEYTSSDFESLVSTNLQSAFNMSQLCYPLLQAANGSCIVFNSSVAGGPTAMKSGSIYAMTKGDAALAESSHPLRTYLERMDVVEQTCSL